MAKLFQRMISGKAIGAQKGFAASINRLFDIIENLDAVRPLKLNKHGVDWRLTTMPDLAPNSESGGVPDGYEEETLNIITDAGIVTRKVLVETSSKASVEAFSSSDSRLLLSINTSGVVRKSKGYL